MDAYEQAMYGMAPSYELTEEEKKRLKMQQLISMGAALMAGRGNFVNNLGQAMLVGQNQGSEGMQDLRRNKLADAEMQWRNAQIADKQRAYSKEMEAQRLAQEQAAKLAQVRAGAPYTLPSMPASQSPTPTTYAAFGMTPPVQEAPKARSEYERQMALYKYYEAQGVDSLAKEHFDRATKVRDEYGLTPIDIDVNGQRGYAQVSKYGGTLPLDVKRPAPIGNVNPGDFTGEQLDAFAKSGGNWSVLGRPIDKRSISNTQVNLPPGESEFEKELGKATAKRYEEYQDAAKLSRTKVNRLEMINNMLTGITTGGSAPLYTKVQNYLASVGVQLPAPGDKAGEAEINMWKKTAAEMLSKEAALHNRSPAGGAGLTGNMSNMDLQFLIDMTPGLQQTEGGRKIHMEMMRRLAKRDAEVARVAQKHRMNYKNFDKNTQDEIELYDAQLNWSDLAEQARRELANAQGGSPQGRTRLRGN